MNDTLFNVTVSVSLPNCLYGCSAHSDAGSRCLGCNQVADLERFLTDKLGLTATTVGCGSAEFEGAGRTVAPIQKAIEKAFPSADVLVYGDEEF